MPGPLLVYGAYGYSGELIARHAVERGLRPVLAGRDRGRLERLAAALGCEARAFALDDPSAVRRGLEGAAAVLHCAGPFADTWAPVARACIDARVHYLDITGELGVFAGISRMADEAERAGVMLLPGTGFDVVPTDCLAAHLVRRLPGTTALVLAFSGLGGRPSRGTMRTMIDSIGKPPPRRSTAPRPAVRRIDLGDGRPVTTVSVPWGDLATAPRSTGVPDVTVYMRAPAAFARLQELARVAAPAVRIRAIRDALAALLTRGASGPTEEERARGRSLFYGEATDAAGLRVVSHLRAPGGYRLTALAAVEIAARVLAGEVKPGWQTPSSAYGPDLVVSLPGCERWDG
jgi:short subunit dehydrogenase-like uncharacterized protein